MQLIYYTLQLSVSLLFADAFSVSKNINAPVTAPAAISVGDKIPFAELDYGFPPQKVPIPEYCAGRSLIIVGLPGAFTPT